MAPTFIGYFPKKTAKRPDWLKVSGVEQICSASNCISEEADGWIDKWLHNELWVYDTEKLAQSAIPEGGAMREFEIYAFKMFPVSFNEGKQEPFELPALRTQPLDETFCFLGYDVVSRSFGNAFECSLLSCNHMAKEVAVNRCCLVDSRETAFELAASFSISARGCEPGLYYIVEGLRKKK